MLLEVGDAILVEEWTYPGAENTFIPYETERVPIKMDGQGLLPEHLENVLGGWNESERGKKRPRVLYTIPTGQNPTGATMMAERKKAIYEVCQKYDVVICEDEPYYCLYTGEWTPKGVESDMSILAQRRLKAEKKDGPDGNQAFLDALPPSFLAFDTDGRVIRMDTFSKTSAPGSRLGWITTSPIFIERLTRATEASTQAPSGFATALTMRMIQQWGLTATFAGCEALRPLTTCAKHGFVTPFKMSSISSLTAAMTCSLSVQGLSLAIQSKPDHYGTRNVVYAALRS
nr:hypothetical protein I308_04323 [Cryptococcus tetragattii IND107]